MRISELPKIYEYDSEVTFRLHPIHNFNVRATANNTKKDISMSDIFTWGNSQYVVEFSHPFGTLFLVSLHLHFTEHGHAKTCGKIPFSELVAMLIERKVLGTIGIFYSNRTDVDINEITGTYVKTDNIHEIYYNIDDKTVTGHVNFGQYYVSDVLHTHGPLCSVIHENVTYTINGHDSVHRITAVGIEDSFNANNLFHCRAGIPYAIDDSCKLSEISVYDALKALYTTDSGVKLLHYLPSV